MTKARLLAVALAAALLASCSFAVQDDDAEKKEGPGTTAGEQGEQARDFSDVPTRGVTDDTVKLGAAVIDTQRLVNDYGVDVGLIPEGVLDALVKAQNDRGGINGRTIELVDRYFLPIGNEDSEKVCRELTEDEQVFLVMGTYLADNALCITETHSTPYVSFFGLTEERMARSKAPYLTTAPMVDDELRADVEALVDSGELADAKVAVYWEGDLKAKWVEANIVEPLVDAGIDVVSKAELPSSGDQVQADADVTRILQRFEADGADTLLNLAGLPVLLPALAKSSYEPRLVFTNGQIMGEGVFDNQGIEDRSAFADALGVVNANTSEEVAADPNFQRCLDDINTAGGLDITTDDIFDESIKPDSRGYGQLPGVCLTWQLTVDVLEAAGDDLTVQSLLDGLADVEPSFVRSDDAELSPTRWGAGGAPRIWDYDVERDSFVPRDAAGKPAA